MSPTTYGGTGVGIGADAAAIVCSGMLGAMLILCIGKIDEGERPHAARAVFAGATIVSTRAAANFLSGRAADVSAATDFVSAILQQPAATAAAAVLCSAA